MISPIYRSNHVPDDFIDKVEVSCEFIGDWGIDDGTVAEFAQILYDYLNDDFTEDQFRQYRKQSAPSNKKNPLTELMDWAEQGTKLLAEIRENPYIRESLLPAYKDALESWPEEIMLGVQDFNTKAVNLYVSETAPPSDAAKDLIETEYRIEALAKACKKAETPADLPSFKAGRKATSDKQSYVAMELDQILSECIETAEERRACIRELFEVIDININDKTLQNML